MVNDDSSNGVNTADSISIERDDVSVLQSDYAMPIEYIYKTAVRCYKGVWKCF